MSNTIQIFHNPRCSKSREALNILQGQNVSVEVIEYLNGDLKKSTLESVLKKLKISAFDLLRKGEDDYKNFVKGKELSENEVVDLMIQYPKLIERPIVINGDKAVVGRPPSLVLDLI
jgi:arsenate reductase (glutaredoxin)